MAAIEISKVVKTFGAVKVLDGIDVEVKDREFIVLVGPSGCGKSTLLRMIAGLESISGGQVAIGGRRVNEVGPQERDLAMVFQSYALYPHMTAAENMGFSLKLRNRPAGEVREEVLDAARRLHLTALLDRYPRQLSGGQRQRVAMGRAIVRDPSAFLFDEPLSNLDAKLRAHMRIEIRQLHDALGATSVYVTHDQVEAMTMADRIVVMNAGRIEQVGTPIELFDTPANLFVAGFLGAPTMNFSGGAVVRDDAGELRIALQVSPRTLPLPDIGSLDEGAEIVLGMRPQHIEIVGEDVQDGVIDAEVRAIEQTGCETNLIVAFGEVEWTIQSHHRVLAATGDAIRLRLDPARVHLFDKQTEKRL